MILGIGVDIVNVSRFHEKEKNPQFLKRVFSAYEQEYLKGRNTESMAGLFAAKEAVAKALGTGFDGFFPCEIEVRHNEKGAPYINLLGKAAELTSGSTFHLSISHTNTDAIAFAVLSK